MVFVQQVSDGSWIDWLNVFHLLRGKDPEVRYVSFSSMCVTVILKVVNLDAIMVVLTRYHRRTDNEFFIAFNVFFVHL